VSICGGFLINARSREFKIAKNFVAGISISPMIFLASRDAGISLYLGIVELCGLAVAISVSVYFYISLERRLPAVANFVMKDAQLFNRTTTTLV